MAFKPLQGFHPLETTPPPEKSIQDQYTEQDMPGFGATPSEFLQTGMDITKGVVTEIGQLGKGLAKTFNEGMAGFSGNLEKIANKLSETTGLPPGDTLTKAREFYERNTDYWDKRIEEEGAPTAVTEFLSRIGGVIPGTAEYLLNVPYAAASGYTEDGAEGAVKHGVERYLLGKIFQSFHGTKPEIAAPAMGATFAAQTAAAGGSVKDIVDEGLLGALLGATGGRGRGFKEIGADIKSMVKGDVQTARQGFRKLADVDTTFNPVAPIESVGEFPLRRRIVDTPVEKSVVDTKPIPIKRAEKRLQVINEENPVTMDHIINQISKTGDSYEGRQRASILKGIGDALGKGKSLDEAVADIRSMAEARGIGPEFNKMLDQIVATLRDDANPQSISNRIGVGGGHGAPTADTSLPKSASGIRGGVPRDPFTPENNASGQTEASLEALRKQKSDTAKGVKHFIIDSRGGVPRPATGLRPEDNPLNPHDVLVRVEGDVVTKMEQGNQARNINLNELFFDKRGPDSSGSTTPPKETKLHISERGVALPELVDFARMVAEGRVPKFEEILLNNSNVNGFFTDFKFGSLKPGDIRLKRELLKDPEHLRQVLAHEIGHAFDWMVESGIPIDRNNSILGKIAGIKDSVMNTIETGGGTVTARQAYKELMALTHVWKPFDPTMDMEYTTYRYSKEELYADAVSALLMNRALVQKVAPTFDALFHEYLGNRPKVKSEYDAVIEAMSDPLKLYERRKAGLEGAYGEGERQYLRREEKTKELSYADSIKQQLIDANAAVQSAVKIESKNTGIKPSPETNPIYALEEATYTHSEVREYLRDIQRNVDNILKPNNLDVNMLADVMLHEHIIHNRENIESTRGYNPKDSQIFLDSMREKIGNEKMNSLYMASRAYRKVRENTIIPVLEKSGIFNQKYMDIIKGREFYARMDVVKYIFDDISTGASGLGNMMKTQLGSFEDVANPFTATVLQDIKLIRAVNINKAAKSVSEFIQRSHADNPLLNFRPARRANVGGRWVPVQPSSKSNFGLLQWVENGKVKGIYVDRYIAEVFKHEPTQANIVFRTLNATNIIWKELFTNRNPGFWLFNSQRDYMRTVKNIEGASMLKFLPSYIGAIKPAFKDAFGVPTDVVRAMHRDKMLISVESKWGLTTEDAAYERMLKRASLHPGSKEAGLVRRVWEAWGNVGQAIERIPKIAGEAYYRKHFPEMPREELGHRIRGQVGSPDFLRKGKLYAGYNNIFLFSNAVKEGWRSDIEVARSRPGEYLYKSAKYNLLPKMVMMAASAGYLNHVMPDAEEIMQKVPEFDKANYFIVPLTLDQNNDAVYLRLPMDETGRFAGGIFWKSMKKAFTDDNQEFKDIMLDLTDYMAGQAPTLTPTLGIPADVYNYTVGNNVYDSYRHRLAVPEGEMEAGASDPRNLKTFGRYEWNKLGGQVIKRAPYDDLKRPENSISWLYDIPVIGPVFQRFVKTSHAGQSERLRAIGKPGAQADARHQLDIKEAIIDDINQIDNPTREDSAKLYKKLKAEGIIEPNFDSPEAFMAKYMKYANRSNANAFYDTIASSKSRKEKVLILKEIENELGADNYHQFMIEGVKRGVITQNLLESKLYLERRGLK